MKIIITSKGDNWDCEVDARFGRTEFFFIYDEDSDSVEIFDNRSIAEEAHGAGPKTASKLAEYGANVLITGNGPGKNAEMVLKETGAEIYTGAGEMTVKEAYNAYKEGKLSKF